MRSKNELITNMQIPDKVLHFNGVLYYINSLS